MAWGDRTNSIGPEIVLQLTITRIMMLHTCGLLDVVVVFVVVKAVLQGNVVSVMVMCHVMTEDVSCDDRDVIDP